MTRGVSPAIGVIVLTGLTVVLAVTVGVAATHSQPDPVPAARFSTDATADQQRIAITHEGGDSLPVDALTVRLRVDGEPLTHQPPVPFFGAPGFVTGPTGPFNSAGDGEWTAGETAAIRLAATNEPLIEPGSAVTVEIRTAEAVIYEETVKATG